MHTGERSVFAHIFFEFNNTIACGENGEVTTKPNALTGVNFGTELANDNITSQYMLTAKAFNATALAYTVASVP